MEQTVTSHVFQKNKATLFLGILSAFIFLPSLLLAQLTVSITQTNVSCNAGYNGSATATATGGQQPYTFLWSNTLSGATISNLAAGPYSVTVTAANGVTATATTTITQPAQLGVTVFGESQICGIVPDGKATAVPFGGTAPYTYLWSNNGTTAIITGLAAGTYTVTVTDAKGCTTAGSTVIQFWNEGVWIMATATNATCFGSNNGSAHVSGMSGTPPYFFQWSTGTTGADISNLAPGSYSVTVTDANGCSNFASVTVAQPTILTAAVTSTPATCANTGTATVTPSGGTPPYSVLWNNGSTNFTISNLAPGSYSVTVKDANNCSKNTSVTVSGTNTNLTVSTGVVANATCNGGGSASANVLGGSGNYTYLWDNGQTTQTATGLTAGNHSVTVMDATSSCTGTGTVNIPQSGSPTVSTTVTTQATCNTGGSATANVSGGTAPYTYKWDNNQTTQTATNLSIGTHFVTVTDAGGCVATGSVIIVQPQGPSVTTQVLANATCLTGGQAKATATGGTAPYVYLWDNGFAGATASNLSAGAHTVTVTDAAGCSATGSVTIGQAQGPTATATAITPATCTTGGSAIASATGGLAPYSYKWDNNQTTATATNLSQGNHSVTVTDANGCTSIAMVTITKTPNPTVTATAITPASCVTGGSAIATGAGGTPPYTYKWDNNQTTATATNLSAGVHTVTVTDAGGCTATATVTIGSTPTPVAVISASSNAKCDQPGSASVVAMGGTAPYTYKWDNNETTATAINLSAGQHSVTVTDAGGCTATASVTIGQTNNGINIGDYVWYDNDQDGFQNALETTGVPNMTVMLIKPGPDGNFGTADDITVKSVVTNSNGNYLIDCVTPGTYILMFSGLPAGYEFSGKDKVNNDCLDSDVKPNGKTEPFTIVAGQSSNLCFDAGIHTLCDNVHSAGLVCCDQTICEGDAPAPIVTLQAPQGGSGGVQYQWLQLVAQPAGPPQWIGIAGANGESYTPGPLSQTSYFMRCARSIGCIPFLESNVVTITVLPAGTAGCGPFLANFHVNALTAHSVNVEWTARPETAQYMYFVQHSTDNLLWKDVASKMGNHDATGMNNYSVIDNNPIEGKNLYRIKRTDVLGEILYSEIVELDMSMDEQASLVITPNPVKDKIFIKNTIAYESDVMVQICNVAGQVLYSFEIPAGSQQNAELSMNNFPSGVYFARVKFNTKAVQTVKILKY